ncbi:hypothetical protein L596_021399 [Steinernema carpocapsae]|uniref:Uncharacterized protein n=1 Tax=Steinernema carpocapsae TaxID=34508 RepID=A0A4V5ZZY1_STECR|nr:hypothetical protein L596_021399 [Steinernema carpocapsae]
MEKNAFQGRRDKDQSGFNTHLKQKVANVPIRFLSFLTLQSFLGSLQILLPISYVTESVDLRSPFRKITLLKALIITTLDGNITRDKVSLCRLLVRFDPCPIWACSMMIFTPSRINMGAKGRRRLVRAALCSWVHGTGCGVCEEKGSENLIILS